MFIDIFYLSAHVLKYQITPQKRIFKELNKKSVPKLKGAQKASLKQSSHVINKSAAHRQSTTSSHR